jgi:opacity protein-like surface antigen
MKLIRYLALGTTLLLPLLTTATSLSASQKNQGEWYAGVGAGATTLFNKASADCCYTGKIGYGAFDALGSLFGGYSYHFANRFNLGGEVFGDLRSAKYTDYNFFQDTYAAKLQYTYGLRMMPGYQVNPTASLHGLLGVVRGNFRSTYKTDADTSNLDGFQAGVGGQLNLTARLGLRGDLIYSQYQRKTILLTTTRFENNFSTLDGIISIFYNFA